MKKAAWVILTFIGKAIKSNVIRLLQEEEIYEL